MCSSTSDDHTVLGQNLILAMLLTGVPEMRLTHEVNTDNEQ